MRRLIWIFAGRTSPKVRFLTLRLKRAVTDSGMEKLMRKTLLFVVTWFHSKRWQSINTTKIRSPSICTTKLIIKRISDHVLDLPLVVHTARKYGNKPHYITVDPQLFSILYSENHCENTPIQIYWKFHQEKLKIVRKKFWYFLYFCSQHR